MRKLRGWWQERLAAEEGWRPIEGGWRARKAGGEEGWRRGRLAARKALEKSSAARKPGGEKGWPGREKGWRRERLAAEEQGWRPMEAGSEEGWRRGRLAGGERRKASGGEHDVCCRILEASRAVLKSDSASLSELWSSGRFQNFTF